MFLSMCARPDLYMCVYACVSVGEYVFLRGSVSMYGSVKVRVCVYARTCIRTRTPVCISKLVCVKQLVYHITYYT